MFCSVPRRICSFGSGFFFSSSSSWLLFDLAGERMTEPVNTDQTEIENEWDWCVSAFGAMLCMCKFKYIKWTQTNISRVRCVYLFLFLCCVVHTSRLTLRNWVLLGLLVFVVHRFLPPYPFPERRVEIGSMLWCCSLLLPKSINNVSHHPIRYVWTKTYQQFKFQ